MSNRGRPRKSIDELKKSGSYRPSRHGIAPSAEVDSAPVRPVNLTGVAAQHWDRLMVALTGRVVAADGPLLSMACEWLAIEQECREALAGLEPSTPEHGRVLRSAASAAAAADRILKGFALTPAMRAKLPAPPPPVDPRGGKFFPQRTPRRPPTQLDRMGPPKHQPSKES